MGLPSAFGKRYASTRITKLYQIEIGPGDVARIEPGHDAWVIGDEACIAIDFGISSAYAKPQ